MSERIPSSYLRQFSLVPDPRKSVHLIRHDLFDMIFIAISACVSGVDDWEGVCLWGESQKGWLQKFCTLENGIPSEWTFRRVFRLLDPDALQAAFIRWMQGIEKGTGSVLAVDGKTVRRSFDRKDGKGAIHLVSAWLAQNRVVLAQKKVADKSNEITAIPELLSLLEIEGLVVTIDAMGCQKDIAAKIIEKKAEYALAVKDNQKRLHADLQDTFAALLSDTDDLPCYSTHDRGHGREETRRYFQTEDLSRIRDRAAWPGLKSVGLAYSERTADGKTSSEARYYICSFPCDRKRFGNSVREHWSIENSLHWVLDVAFDEDQKRTRKGHGAENIAVIRRIALNLLRDCPMKGGVKNRRILANANCDIREKILKI